MNRISLIKYGFERDLAGDFSDDGNSFTCYILPAAPNIRVSKLVEHGSVYISGSFIDNKLDYEEYKDLPKYNEVMWALNGKKTLYELTEDDLQTFVENCILLNDAYNKAVANAETVSDDEIKAKYTLVQAQAQKDYAKAMEAYNGIMYECMRNPYIPADNYYFKQAVEYLKNAIYQTYTICNTTFEKKLEQLNKVNYTTARLAKRSFLKEEVKPNWYLDYAIKYFNEAVQYGENKKAGKIK